MMFLETARLHHLDYLNQGPQFPRCWEASLVKFHVIESYSWGGWRFGQAEDFQCHSSTNSKSSLICSGDSLPPRTLRPRIYLLACFLGVRKYRPSTLAEGWTDPSNPLPWNDSKIIDYIPGLLWRSIFFMYQNISFTMYMRGVVLISACTLKQNMAGAKHKPCSFEIVCREWACNALISGVMNIIRV